MTKKIAFLFPGQGSQSVGMLNAFKMDSGSADIFQQMVIQARQSLEDDIVSVIENGPEHTLSLTVNTQPAMLMADAMVYSFWRQSGGPKPCMAAGHSLGEYVALMAAGVFSFTDAIKLVRIRAQAMQQVIPAGQGGMAAILGLTDEQVQQACAQANQSGEVAEAVNFNAPNQVVIAGTLAGVLSACAIAKELGAKRAVQLPVSAPFHSSLMKPASVQLQAALRKVKLNTPEFDVINNIDVAIQTEAVEIEDALVRQAYGPVRWVETIKKMTENGAELFVECGPGKVLAGLVKRINDTPVVSISDPESIRTVLASL